MKKIFLMFLMLAFVFCLAIPAQSESLIIKTSCQIRDTSDFKTSTQIGVALEKESFEILDRFGDYYFVSVYDIGQKSVFKGWMWQGKMEINGLKFEVIDQGVSLRSSPAKDYKVIVNVLPGSSGQILNAKYTWFKIKKGDLLGWISSSCIELIKPKK